MRILFCIPTLEIGGAERQLSYLAPELARLGDEVHVACTRGGPFRERLNGIKIHDARNLVRLMRRLKPDVVQTCLTRMDVLGGAAALLTRTPWVLREASTRYPKTWRNILRRAVGRRASAIVANSREGAAYWRTHHVIPNGVPLAEIDRTAAGVRSSVLFAGRMDEGKNVRTLLAALQQLDVDATFCGDGPCRAELQRIAGERIAFPGYVDDLWARMKGAGAVVSLSRFEGSSNVVLEAMACGTPLVVSDIASHRELLGDGGALFVPCDDAAAAAHAIRETLASPDAAAARARAARARVEPLSVEAMARAYREVYAAHLSSRA